jgi:hypothetical protein
MDPSWPAQVENAHELVATYYPGELGLFGHVVAEYQIDPRRVLGRTRLRAPVGAGVELGIMTPYVLSVMWFLFAAVTVRVVDRATDALIDRVGRSTRDKLAVLLRQRTATTGDPLTGPCPEPHDARTAPTRLDAAEEKELHEVVVARSTAAGLGPDEARRLAEAMIGWLRSRDGRNRQA